jgi:stage III sporulation protein AD
MEQVIQVAGICVVGALLAVLLKRTNPELALLLTVGAAAVIFLSLAGTAKELLKFLQTLSRQSGVSDRLLTPLYKTLGIALVVKTGGDLCRDAGENAMASVLETAGTLSALLVSLPLLQTVLSMLMELMRK